MLSSLPNFLGFTLIGFMYRGLSKYLGNFLKLLTYAPFFPKPRTATVIIGFRPLSFGSFSVLIVQGLARRKGM